MNDTVIKAFNLNSAVTEVWSSCGAYLTVAELVFEWAVPEGVEGFKGMAKVGVLESIQDHCWNLAGYLQNEELTEENIVHIRQSYMTALRASRQMFESQEDLTELVVKFGAEEYADVMKPQLESINMKIQQLIASADCTENDSVEGKQEYANRLEKMFANISSYSSSQSIYTAIEHGIFLAALKEAEVENLVWDVADGNNDGINELYVECNSGGWGKSLLFYDVARDYRWSFTETGVAGSTSWVNFSDENGYAWQRSYGAVGTQTQSYIAWHSKGWESLAAYGRFLEEYGTDGSDDVYSAEYKCYGDEITYEDFIRYESNTVSFTKMGCPNLLNMEWDGKPSQIQTYMDTYFEKYEGLMAIVDKDLDKDGIVEHSYLLQGAAERTGPAAADEGRSSRQGYGNHRSCPNRNTYGRIPGNGTCRPHGAPDPAGLF